MAKAGSIVGSGAYTYRVVADWAKLPAGWTFRDVAAVATDSADRVYVFNRGEHPMCVFDRDGNLLSSWARGCSTGRTGCMSARTGRSIAPMTATLHR